MTIEYQIIAVKGSSKINIEFRLPRHKYGEKPVTFSGAIKNPGTLDDLKTLLDRAEAYFANKDGN